MAHLRMEAWAHWAEDDTWLPLPDLASWQVSPTDGDDGSAQIVYPINGRNAHAFEPLRDFALDTDVEVELTLSAPDGRTWVDRALLFDLDVDEVAEGALITANGLLLGCIFREVVVPYHPTGENGETPVAGTAGYIVRTLIEAAQGRGCLDGVTLDFTDSHDSNGDPWEREGTFRLSPGQTYGAMLGMVRGYQLGEHRLTPDRVLHLYNPDGKGIDRTGIEWDSLTLEHGRDVRDAPRKRRLRDAVTALFSSGKDGIYSSDSDAFAEARRGRRIEGYHSFGNTADQGTLDALTQSRLGTQRSGRTEVSHALALGPGHPLPLIDFQEADYVFSSTRRGLAYMRVAQITVSGAESEATSAAVTLGTQIDGWAVAQQRRLDDIASGAAVVGTSMPPPEVDDGSTPPQVEDVVATSLWYATGEGVGLAAVTAGWTTIPDDRIVGYAVEWRHTDAALGTGWRRQAIVEGDTAQWSGVTAGAEVEVRVAAVNRWERLGPWSAVYSFTTELDGTPPPVASTPAPYASLGLLVVPWDGKGTSDAPMPGDFDTCEIHISTTSDFTPHRPLVGSTLQLDTAASTTYAGELRAAGEYPVDVGPSGYGVTFFVKLVTRDRTGNAAAASAQGSVVGRPVQDGEISSMSIGKLTAGIMTALMTISGIIRTAASGARVELDTAGLRCYSSSGALLFDFSIPDNLLTITGRILVGLGVGSGATIDINPSGPRMRWYPNATTMHAEDRAYVMNLPADAGGGTSAGREEQFRNTSGQTDGPMFQRWAAGVFLTFKNTAGNLFGGRLMLFPDSAWLSAGSGAASAVPGGRVRVGTDGEIDIFNDDADARIRIEADGDIRLNPASGKEVTSSLPFGSRSNGMSFFAQSGDSDGYRFVLSGGGIRIAGNDPNTFMKLGDGAGDYKNFVIPHPTDPDRWLVHACTESPQAGVEYWGEVEIVDGQAIVELPPYFEALTQLEGRTVQVTPVLDESDTLPRVAASTPRGGRFRIACDGPDGTRVAWLVHAVRADAPQLVAEPLRADVEVAGFGPYRTITDRSQGA